MLPSTDTSIENVTVNSPTVKVMGSRKCRVCNSENCQKIKECKKFLGLNVKKRWEIVNKYHLCRTCLRYHRGFPCRNFKSCGVNNCTTKHHHLLHNEKIISSDDKTTGDNITDNKSSEIHTTAEIHTHWINETTVLFRILPITLYNGNISISTYAFIDDGSSVTLLDESLMEELSIDGEKIHYA